MKTLVTLFAMLAMTGCASLPTNPSTVQELECRKLSTMKIQSGFNYRCSNYGGSGTCSGGPNWKEVVVEENLERCMKRSPQSVHKEYMAAKAKYEARFCAEKRKDLVDWGTCENQYPPYTPDFTQTK